MSAFASLIEEATGVEVDVFVYLKADNFDPGEVKGPKGARVIITQMLELLKSYPGARLRRRPTFFHMGGHTGLGAIGEWRVTIRFVDYGQSSKFWSNVAPGRTGRVIFFTGSNHSLEQR